MSPQDAKFWITEAFLLGNCTGLLLGGIIGTICVFITIWQLGKSK